eukprot:gb/GECH01007161.1/.p1 GENE.gb/GECH01007161.1/~~gb/GECH01007161.1/.p1  ORF type:complete len:1219 (+),score=287.52 gb/GECH01007161.1/:1-3657(+)
MSSFNPLSLVFLFSLLFLLGFSNVNSYEYSDETPTCDVSLQPSQTLLKYLKSNQIDFSQVKAKLLNAKTGTILESMYCSSEGIVMLPVFDTNIQNYEVEIDPPKGWIFDKVKQPITISSENEVYFDLQGFTIQGKVYSKSMDGSLNSGPGGVQVSLEGESLSTQPLEEITSEEDGSFLFTNILPGSYTIRAKHHSYNFEKDTVNVQVHAEPLDMRHTVDDSNQLVVGGYSVDGLISVGNSGDSLSGATMFLVPLQDSTASLSLSCDKPSKEQSNLIDEPHVACATTSDSQGKYIFKGIPKGSYRVVSHYKGFRIQPSSMEVKVTSESVSISKPFQVKDFTASGFIQTHDKQPIARAKVDLKKGSSKIQSVLTEKDGKFTFENIESGTFSVEVTKDEYSFEKIKVNLSPIQLNIPTISVMAYEVCGSLNLAPVSKELSELDRKSTSQILIEKQNEESKTVNINSNGKYCTHLAPGSYTVKSIVSKKQSELGLSFIPEQQSVEINKPTSLQEFNQKTVSISGQIETVSGESMGNSIEISCRHLRNYLSPRTVKTDKSGEFKFEGLLPGSYKITSDHDEWCWETDTSVVEALDDVSDVKVSQKGFRMTYIMDHDNVNLTVAPKDDPTNKWTETLMSGKHHICLPNAGKYNISTNSCFRFNKDEFEYDTNHPHVIDFDAVSFLVTGSIRVNAETADELLKEPRIVVKIKGSPDKTESNAQSTVAEYSHEMEDESSGRKEKNRYYQFDYWASIGEHLEFVPVSSSLLFYPRSRTITVSSAKECLPPLESFEGRPGKYIEGKADPPVSNASVRIFSQDHSSESEVASAVTNESGWYRAGPLYDDLEYYADMYKKGFQFERESENNPFNFQSFEFSTLDVKILDDTSGQTPVDGVFVSVSGRQSGGKPQLFKFKALSNENGRVEIDKLPPGSYTLRMQSKEYRLDPASTSINVGQKAEQKQINVKASRVAYSVYGTVRSLTGDPQDGVVVSAAVKSSNDVEQNDKGGVDQIETQTNEKGIYRLRGLIPGKQYVVTVDSSISVARSSPEKADINVSNEDVKDIDFVVFFRKKTFDITGTVDTSLSWFDKVDVELLAGNQVIQRQPLPISRFFEFPGLSRDATKYKVRLNPRLNKRAYDFTTSEKTVEVEKEVDSQHINLEFEARLRTSAEANGTPAFSLIFIILGIAAFFYRSQLPELIQQVKNFKESPSRKKRKKKQLTNNSKNK